MISNSYTLASQLLARNTAHFEDKDLLIAGYIEDTYPTELAKIAKKVTLFSYDYSAKLHFDNVSNIDNHCSTEYQAVKKHQVALIYMSKSKAEVEYLLANITEHLEDGAMIFMVGENNAGIRSANKFFAPYGDICNKLDAARRSSLFVTELNKPVAKFVQDDWVTTFPISVNGVDLTVCTLPGVFSHGKLDTGSNILLNNLHKKPSGRVLDLGCGAGIIGSYIAKRFPESKVEMTDVSALAVKSSQLTLAANELAGQAYLSDVYSDVEGTFDYIISNPPFHAGLKTHYASTETFLKEANGYINTRGHLVLVANSFLKYPEIIEAAFGHCLLQIKSSKFAVYYANK
ncbi:16S rRNA (guanine(1207)-N(2))-methyltransferase RsmC [Moritella sp. F3]|uniref:16S rRNA (guanine(1207)-N(2))-methyltransferase RsmC n=1 Tax=Moritella sp. F3 TaxID=2718882 RepID=UPI0018E1888B|nr:16S rRNA (guanine(1207)-N(2))-methyltransferase RsmC [Moritella sp. F3]GIC76183.1 ribosomal RNA small subunit methyltransferase C [Moritella sp. F1]GIC82714.1 ribosomal RNA small subunit methyltransferase C [Moritella sp. F3]